MVIGSFACWRRIDFEDLDFNSTIEMWDLWLSLLSWGLSVWRNLFLQLLKMSYLEKLYLQKSEALKSCVLKNAVLDHLTKQGSSL